MKTTNSLYKGLAVFKPISDNLWDRHSFFDRPFGWSLPLSQPVSFLDNPGSDAVPDFNKNISEDEGIVPTSVKPNIKVVKMQNA